MKPLAEVIQAVMPHAALTDAWAAALQPALDRYEINTPARLASFLAQIAHESDELRYVKELWGPTQAQGRYEYRKDLGNDQSGDGFRFRGRGLIQITGRRNYLTCGVALDLPLTEQPELLELRENAALSAAWWWQAHGCNELADAGDETAQARITRVINGGMNGWDKRKGYWDTAKKELGI
jgi:putative chitinase